MIRIQPLSLFLSIFILLAGGDDTFDWSSITPSANLVYSPCFGHFQCARLLLPLDWPSENGSDTTSIAMIKLPAAVSQDHATFGGAIFVNPGGPGGSGVQFLLDGGRLLQSIVNIPRQKYYEMISFDPRGVGASEPRVDCYPANNVARRAKILETTAAGALNLSSASFDFGYFTARALGKRCEMTNAHILPFVNTASVARDMLAMVDKVAELRKKQTIKQQKTDVQSDMRKGDVSSDNVPRLQYYGLSYGTILGNYFASLFPGRVSRMVLDGVVDSDDWANGPGWLTMTQDADKMMELLFEGCFTAGPWVCPLRQPSDKSPTDISNRTWSWIKARDAEPIEAKTPDGSADVLLRSADIRHLIMKSLYHADYRFVTVASQLAEAMRGNPEPLATSVLRMFGISDPSDACTIGNDTTSTAPTETADPYNAVICTNGVDVSGENSTYWRSYMERQGSISTFFGELVASARLACAAWRVRPNWSFKGPFKTPTASKDPSSPESNRPAAPLLFLSSKWDPVTPLRNARAMASRHPGAGVLVEGSMGHCALGGGYVSKCLKSVVSEYFDKGVVPEKEVSCKGTKNPWSDIFHQNTAAQGLMQERNRHHFLGV
ncbi:hypothetical protein BB8028_0001g03080 [Beauveria bassiana]|uniref:Peptidase S33 tripeptidyl aminopeptidase-like C-terminal domain-containing protein n=1 Tax=Beauveria bassiana TaxID=176275 RepID=A0A2S7XWD2_BEABA|nr:hypothetical protein BB8028_0001g03080 [Beauveria bassiana]